AVDRFDELAACALAAIGDGRAARALLDRPTGAAATTTETAVATIVAATAVATTTGAATTARRPLLAAWLDLRAGRYAAAGDGLVAAASTPVLRRDAVLAAAVSVGLARRSGGERSLAATWHRVAPVVAGADVEILLLDVWGELSVAAALVSPGEQHGIAEAMAAAVARAGNPWWALATDCWWRLARADAAADTADAARAAAALAALAAEQPLARPAADAAAVWADALAGTAAPGDVARTAADLAARGHRFEAERLCATAADRATEPDAARALLGAGRRLRERPTGAVATVPDALSPREREVGALVIDGLTHKEIGRNLYISPKTVEQHVARMRQKLAATTRADLVAALRANL
ncbi:MAG: helix-turn-helix transcriptional regulator, partial [Pseudonocardia sp.]|nr:helix-turn-helix transcriptional regulator [Pseudonocardia sp.]